MKHELLFGFALFVGTAAMACGSDTGSSGNTNANTSSGAGASASNSSSSGATGGGGTGGSVGVGGNGGGGSAPTKDQSCVALVDAAQAFLGSLDANDLSTATADFGSDEHTHFEFLPPLSAARDGLTMKNLDTAQRDLLANFLKAAMSAPGYAKLEAIRGLESVLAMQEAGMTSTENRDPENYFIQVFGTPVVDGAQPWGFRFEGHHMSIQAGVIDCTLYSATPAFWGASPQITALSEEVTGGQSLWDSLDTAQQAEAQASVSASSPINTKDAKISPLTADGLAAGSMTTAQQAMLQQLIGAYVNNMNADIAGQRLDAIMAAGFDDIRFAFDGGNYRVLGPTFVIELVSAGSNHIHAVWRDYDGDYGDDLIVQHMADHHHGE